MSFKTNRLRDAICYSLAVGIGALSATSLVHAQTAPASTASNAQQDAAAQKTDAKTLDKILVTGSRIRQTDVETAQPVQMIMREDIEKQGFQSVGDILQNVSAVGTPPISRASPLSAGQNAGGVYISLRNLGAERTLVLLNGKRLGISTSGLADISTIPAIAVERVEILKDGASSTYGSDAIAGVINIITRSNFEGAKASAYFGQYGEGDGSIKKGDAIMGFKGERGSLTAAVEWGEEDGVSASARDFSAFPRSSLHPTDGWTTVGQFGGFQPLYSQRSLFPQAAYPTPTGTNPNPAGSRLVLKSGGNPNNPADYVRQNTNTGTCAGATEATGCSPGSIADKSNTNMQTDLRTPIKSRSLYLDGIYDITDNIRFRTNLLYSARTAERTVAGYPMQAASFNTPMSATSYFNPAGSTIANWWRRGWEVPRVSSSELTTYRFSGVFEGNFTFADRDIDWDVSYLDNNNKVVQASYGNFNLANVRAAVGPSFINGQGVVQCGTALAPINGCVPFNPFLPFGTVGQGGLTNNQALTDYLFQEEHNTGETSTKVFSANVTGTLFTLPAGELRVAVGYEHRNESGEFVPDALAVTGGSTNLSAGPTRGEYSVGEWYAEAQVPLLADVTFAKELTLSVATRYSDYDTFGDTTNSKIGLKWRPTDTLLFRGTIADGFRAPTIADLFGGGSQTFSFFTDPCDTNFGSSSNNAGTRANCVAAMGAVANTYRQLGQGLNPVASGNSQTPVAFTSGSNPTLQPETSRSKTMGVVWSPDFVSGLNFSLDWWKIRLENTIVSDSPTTILNDCYVLGIASRCSPQLFTRDATLGYINFLSFGGRNAGFREVEGFDFDAAYRWKTADWGNFNFVMNTTYTSSDKSVSTNDPRVPLSSVGFTSTFRIRSNANLAWEMGNFGMSWTARYFSGMKEGCTYFIPGSTEGNLECDEIHFAPTGNVTGTTSALTRRKNAGSNTFNDVQGRWRAPWNATIAVGANNVFNRIGPVMYSQPSANVSYYGGFDIGRFFYVKYTQDF
ncbi:MAG: TonB-dependent receptor [Thermomonas sp.]